MAANQQPITIQISDITTRQGDRNVITLVSFSYDQASGTHRLVVDGGDGRRVYTAHQALGTEFDVTTPLFVGASATGGTYPVYTILGESSIAWQKLARQIKRLKDLYDSPCLQMDASRQPTFLERMALAYFREVLGEASHVA